jgi:hypothetical protein
MGDVGNNIVNDEEDVEDVASPEILPSGKARPNRAQRQYLLRGVTQPGGKLPLFDEFGQHVHPALVKACIAHGWAEPWFENPLKPDWQICKLTDTGRQMVSGEGKK